MKTITLNLDDNLLEAAEARARMSHTTLDKQIQIWLTDYADQTHPIDVAMKVVADLQGKLRTGGHAFTRDELNDR